MGDGTLHGWGRVLTARGRLEQREARGVGLVFLVLAIEELLAGRESRIYHVSSLCVGHMVVEIVLTHVLSARSSVVSADRAYLIIVPFSIWSSIVQLRQRGRRARSGDKGAPSVLCWQAVAVGSYLNGSQSALKTI